MGKRQYEMFTCNSKIIKYLAVTVSENYEISEKENKDRLELFDINSSWQEFLIPPVVTKNFLNQVRVRAWSIGYFLGCPPRFSFSFWFFWGPRGPQIWWGPLYFLWRPPNGSPPNNCWALQILDVLLHSWVKFFSISPLSIFLEGPGPPNRKGGPLLFLWVPQIGGLWFFWGAPKF